MFNTHRVLAEINKRNARRKESRLPELSVPHELARMKEVHRQLVFEEFVAESRLLYERIWNRRVGRERRRRDDPDFRPGSWMAGMMVDAHVKRVLGRIFRMTSRREALMLARKEEATRGAVAATGPRRWRMSS